jgi:hypothetical protein
MLAVSISQLHAELIPSSSTYTVDAPMRGKAAIPAY